MFSCRNACVTGNTAFQECLASMELKPFQECLVYQREPQLNVCREGGSRNLAMAAASGSNPESHGHVIPVAVHNNLNSFTGIAVKARTRKFRIPLKKEEGEYKTDNAEYRVEFPFRAALRMQTLMESTRARLNDVEYNHRLHKSQLEEEAKELVGLTHARELAEKKRYRNLVIDGKMEPNKETKYLLKHPVFRVNRMLKRLEMQDAILNRTHKVAEDITPVEPYEFDGNKFFKHLHEEGTYWVPSTERIFQEEKLSGKIARAKLRLMEKRRVKTYQDKVMRTIYNAKHPEKILELGLDYVENESPDVSKKKLEKLREKLTVQFQKQTARFRWKQAMLHTQEKERKFRERERLRERDKDLIEERERARQVIIDKYRARVDKFKTPNHRKAEEEDYTKEGYNARMAGSKQLDLLPSGSSSMNFEKLIALPTSPPEYFEDEAVKQIRKVFNLRDDESMDKYKPYLNPLVEDHMNKVKNADELFLFGNELKDLYLRKQEMANDLVRQLNKIYS